MYIMGTEPLPERTAEEIRAYFEDKNSPKDLADAFALTSNKFWWVEDNVYDYEKGTPEYQEACRISDEWGELMDAYKARIFEILVREGISIPSTGQIKVLEPFMAKYGYADGNGWWIKE